MNYVYFDKEIQIIETNFSWTTIGKLNFTEIFRELCQVCIIVTTVYIKSKVYIISQKQQLT